jgi:hypothetical protein
MLGSDEESIPAEHAARSAAAARATRNVDVNRDDTKNPRGPNVRGEMRRDASLARR